VAVRPDLVLNAKGDFVFFGTPEQILDWIAANKPVPKAYRIRIGSTRCLNKIEQYRRLRTKVY
jgi:hypothetical protein